MKWKFALLQSNKFFHKGSRGSIGCFCHLTKETNVVQHFNVYRFFLLAVGICVQTLKLFWYRDDTEGTDLHHQVTLHPQGAPEYRHLHQSSQERQGVRHVQLRRILRRLGSNVSVVIVVIMTLRYSVGFICHQQMSSGGGSRSPNEQV